MGKIKSYSFKKADDPFSELRSRCLNKFGQSAVRPYLKNTRLLTHCNTVFHQITLNLTHNCRSGG